MGRPPRPLLWIAGAIVVLALLLGAGLPSLVAWRLEAALARSLQGRPQVVVRTTPGGAVTGRLRQVRADVRSAVVNRIPVDRLRIDLRGVEVDASRLYLRRQFVLRAVASGEGEVVLTQADLQRLLRETKGVSAAAVTLDDGMVTVEGDVRLEGFARELPLHVRLEGRLVATGPTTVGLHVRTLTLSGLVVPGEFGNALVGAINPLLDLRDLPVPARITDVRVDDGAARIAVAVTTR
ncbi:MAG: DUF2993 domain-containing protein [Armatimonadota bacterium]|nr:DUF2993 domain-containing protein [Armatimonadota bacterium]MDR7447888.1 DUF2993 domain-containing protein [Armatimonadota bacterium]MDR7459905.1 DUF2993 domain-containing protein [Armatimonadota bacterium]MDR7479764.1 DUF2993 domain-containing protein [Armatimonadota bacterium]MDR7487573.1 DUF2993 domain-containing protein [Armatimonadota bacterium]